MGLETGTGIGDLVPTNPLSTDAVSSGDDHIRLIKTVMQSITFFKNIVSFTISGTWTRPANVKKILIYCIGGGGGGGGGTVGSYSGGGGSSGAIAIKWLDVTAIPSASVSLGAGGTGGVIGAPGTNGVATDFFVGGTVYCRGLGGLAGAVAASGALPDASAPIGDLIFWGSAGAYGKPPHPTVASHGGIGGGSGNPTDANAYGNSGGGGGGGYSSSSSASAGTNGGYGYCFVLEFGW